MRVNWVMWSGTAHAGRARSPISVHRSQTHESRPWLKCSYSNLRWRNYGQGPALSPVTDSDCAFLVFSVSSIQQITECKRFVLSWEGPALLNWRRVQRDTLKYWTLGDFMSTLTLYVHKHDDQLFHYVAHGYRTGNARLLGTRIPRLIRTY